jgi:SAM-dependent methyltransferase
MSKDVLQKHYEKKYAHEATNIGIRTIPIVSRPTDRCQAAIKYIPRYIRGGAILELGAGDGAIAKTLLELDPGIDHYTLGDISLPRVDGIAANIRDPRVRVLLLDAEHICETEVERFDAVIMVALIEHLVDPMGAMSQIRMILKPGGIVYIDTPNIAKYTRRMQLLLGKFPSTASKNEGLTTYEGTPADLHDEGHLHYFTYRSLSSMLVDRCGFSRVEKLHYPCGRLLLGERMESWLAAAWPEAFSELVLVAHN